MPNQWHGDSRWHFIFMSGAIRSVWSSGVLAKSSPRIQVFFGRHGPSLRSCPSPLSGKRSRCVSQGCAGGWSGWDFPATLGSQNELTSQKTHIRMDWYRKTNYGQTPPVVMIRDVLKLLLWSTDSRNQPVFQNVLVFKSSYFVANNILTPNQSKNARLFSRSHWCASHWGVSFGLRPTFPMTIPVPYHLPPTKQTPLMYFWVRQ